MCGIIGLYAPCGVNSTTEAFERAMRLMRVRGPDDSGVWRDHQVWLGHQRLSIMDTSSAGHQPMVSPDGRYVLLFNGAIYNHQEIRAELGNSWQWHSTGDTETLLAAFSRWGIACLSKLNGMFAFSIWDRELQRLYLARDRMGVKPLYFGWHSGQLVFASRPVAAATLLPSVSTDYDDQAVRWYLECGFIPGQHSLFKSLKKLPPAHYLVTKGEVTRVERYWDYRHLAPDKAHCSELVLLDEFQTLFDSAVKYRLLSDVPLGVFLSSGTDSSLVAASMRRIGASKHQAFTISFAEKSYDEGPLTQKIANHLGMNLVVERLTADNLLDALPDYFKAVDEPIADAAGIATLVLSKSARRHITVALTGDGGDELFGGYPHYLRLLQLSKLLKWPDRVRHLMASAMRIFPWHNGKLMAGAMRLNSETDLFHYLRSMSKDFPPLIQKDLLDSTVSSVELFEQSAASMALDLNPIEMAGRLDMAFTLPDLYFQKVDMATMAHSIEARSPFMDYRLVEWAMRLPPQVKFDGYEGKSILKKALCRSLPSYWVYREKRGFSVPIGKWLAGPLHEWAADSLRDTQLTSRLPVDWPMVQNLLDWQVKGQRNTYPLVWAALMLLECVRHHGAQEVEDNKLQLVA